MVIIISDYECYKECETRAWFSVRFIFTLGNANDQMTFTRVCGALNCLTSLQTEFDIAFTGKLSSGKTSKGSIGPFFFRCVLLNITGDF